MEGSGTSASRIVPGKIGVPPFRLGMVSRSRLLDLLDSPGPRVSLVSAPAGSGKTVLVLDWLRRSELSAAWLSLDSLDNDPGRFFPHFIAALRAAGSRSFLKAAEAGDQASGVGAEIGPSILPVLSRGDASEILVLDDAHTLEPGPVLEFVRSLVTGMDSGPRLVLLARTDPPIPLSRLRLDGTLQEIRQEDLRFREEEAAELLGHSLPGKLDASTIRILEERTEGWAAGLRMATVVLERARDVSAAAEAFRGTHELMVEYLLEQALASQSEPLQRFLMETSILPRFTSETCVAVTGDPRAPAFLREVEAKNLFLVSLDDRQEWYRYHHLFRELMEFRLQTLLPERVGELRDRASRWFEAQGDVEEAMEQASAMEERGRLIQLLDAHGYDTLARSEFGSFSRWVRQVPEPLSAPHPMFLVALAWFRAQTERNPDLSSLLRAIEESIRQPPDDYPEARIREAGLHLAVLRAFVLRLADRLEEAIVVGEEVLAALPADAERMRGILQFNMGAIHLRLGEMEKARRQLETAYEKCLGSRIPYLVLASLGHMGSVSAQTRGLPTARRELEAAVTFAQDRGLAGVPAFAIILYQLAHVHYLADELDSARGHLERALALTRGERETDILANVLIQLARLEGAAGNHDRADELLREGAALAYAFNVKPFGTTLDVERARLAEAREGRLQTPEEAPPSAETAPGWTTWREAEAVFQLQQCLKLGRDPCAREWARALKERSYPRQRGVALTVALLAEAVAAERSEDRDRALSEGLQLAAGRGYVRPVLDCGPSLRALLASSHTGADLPAPVRAFVRDRLLSRFPSGPIPTVATPETELTEKELEVLGYLAQGLTNDAIAQELFVSVNTVKTHLKHVFAKLGTSTRTESVREAQKRGLLPTPE